MLFSNQLSILSFIQFFFVDNSSFINFFISVLLVITNAIIDHINVSIDVELFLVFLIHFITFVLLISDLTRQYMTMQFQLETKVEYLETKVRKLQQTLGKGMKVAAV